MGKQTKGSASRRLMSVLVILAMLLQSLSLSAFAQDDDALSEVDEVISGSAVETDSAADSTTDSAFAEEVNSIDTVEPEINLMSAGIELTREEIISRLGFTKEFAVFAKDFVNDNHMEGAIAVQNLNGAYNNIGNTANVYQYTPDFEVTLAKSVTDDTGSKEGTFRFGFFIKNSDGTYTKSDIPDVYVTTGPDGTGSTTLTRKFGSGEAYYVFEIDDNGNPIIESDVTDENGDPVINEYGNPVKECKGTVNGKTYDVTYNSNGINGASYVSSVGNTSYVEYFRQPGCGGIELFQRNETVNPKVVIGETNTIEGYNDGSDVTKEYIVGEDGGRYLIERDYTEVNRVEGPFPIDFDAEFDNLTNLSMDLAQAKSNDEVKVVTIPVKEEGWEQWDHSDYVRPLDTQNAVIDGEVVSINGDHEGISTDGKFLIINVDCTKANPTDRIEIPRVNINGIQPSNWNDVASNVIWNFYTTENGVCKPFTGKVNNYELFGTMLAPRGKIICGASTNGSVIAADVSHNGCEIHHIPALPVPGTIARTVSAGNAVPGSTPPSETTTKEATTESTTVTTTTETTTVTTTETTTEETTTVTTTETTTETTTVTTTTVATTTEATTAALTTVTESTTEENTTPPGDDNKHTTTTESVTETSTESTTVGPTTTSTTEATTEETSTESTTTAGPTTTSTTEATTETTTETTTEATTIETTSEVTTAELTTKPDSGHPHEHPSTTTEATTVAATTEATTETTTAAPTTEATTEATTIAPTTEATTEATTIAPTTEATTETPTETTTVAELTTKPDGGHPHEHPSTEATTEITTAAPTTVAPTTEAASETTTVAEMTTTKPSGGGGNPPDEPTPEESSVEDTTATEVTSEATTASIESTTEITTSIEASSEATTNETPDITETPPDTPDTPDTPGTPGNPPGGRGPRTPDTPDTPGSPGSPDSPGGSTGFSFNRPRSSITAPDGSAVMSLRRPHSAITPPADAPTTTVTNVTRPKVAASLPKTGDPTANGIAVMLILLAGAVFMFTLKRPKK